MQTKDFTKELSILRENIISELKDLLKANNNKMNIPLWVYNPIDKEISDLIEDGFDISVINDNDEPEFDNISIRAEVWDYIGMEDFEILAIEIRYNEIEVITTQCGRLYFSDIIFIEDMITIYNRVIEVLQEKNKLTKKTIRL